MPKFVLYDIENDVFHNYYEEDQKKVFGGPWGNEAKHVHIEIPDGIDYRKNDLSEVILEEGQKEDDIIFDYKCEYVDNFSPVVKYYFFEYNTAKGDAIDALDAENALKDAKNLKRDKGDDIKKLCDNIRSIIAGHVRDNDLTPAQIDQMKIDNATAFQLLKDGQPITARPYMDALTVDGTLITQQMYDDIQLEYSEFDEAYPDI